ncbi:DUF2231 domain-containing protein [Pedobacter sandarakinus]|uniref:DUF2231 domain-containing protein n=1 Tax=Pedobacter sandarakinus TaxID=353156 RepID=UPI002245FE68|nr:DUF2231 domain-containing protein [Pedobacter sandarakinus]MCX2575397.1 hypothetical protein [Pedobacter sandarakinus]
MNQIPSMWRTELWHPMLVHLPIATLLLATVAGLIAAFLKKGRVKLALADFTFILLTIGVITIWMGIYTGLLAYKIEVRTLCDPQVLKTHQYWAYIAAYIYTFALVVQLISFRFSRWKIWFRIVRNLLLLAGCLALGYCGHLGASVVYQQGGGVYKPSVGCKEFIK